MKKGKKVNVILIALMLMVFGNGCSTKTVEEPLQETAETVAIIPQVSKMKAICELSTMDCYFHNVAKYYEEDAAGALWWKKDKNFWVEYSGVVSIGLDISQVDITVNGESITITLPEAQVLDSTVDETTLTESSFIIDKDSANIDANDQIKALQEAQEKMEQMAAVDGMLLSSAQQRAEVLLQDYINNIGKATGKEYNIEWIYIGQEQTEVQNPQVDDDSLESDVEEVEEVEL